MDSLDEMAATATTVYQANAAALVSSVDLDDNARAQVNAVRRPPRQSGGRSSGNSGNSRRRGGVSLCKTHSNYGRDAFKCDRPGSCPMRDVLKTPPSGNAPAGRG